MQHQMDPPPRRARHPRIAELHGHDARNADLRQKEQSGEVGLLSLWDSELSKVEAATKHRKRLITLRNKESP
jgi:hypothetical protein